MQFYLFFPIFHYISLVFSDFTFFLVLPSFTWFYLVLLVLFYVFLANLPGFI